MERIRAILLKAKPVKGTHENHYIREAVQFAILEVISSDKELLDSMVFQGGTALRLCYGLNRLSEDLYFVAGKEFAKAGLKLGTLVKNDHEVVSVGDKVSEGAFRFQQS